MMQNSYCHGKVIHNRTSPKNHRFTYQMSWCLFDIDLLEQTMANSRWFSLNRFNIVSLHNRDYINSDDISIKEKIRQYLKQQSGQPFDGQVFLFTHPKYIGFGFNSVNFYFCFKNQQLHYIVSEINNTPWKQKHLYFHNVIKDNQTADHAVFRFKKDFHISPFADMNINYTWRFCLKDEHFSVAMLLERNGEKIMNVALNTQLQPMTTSNQLKWIVNKPFQALKMFTGIYWQALKIWCKGIPFFSHPQISAGKKDYE